MRCLTTCETSMSERFNPACYHEPATSAMHCWHYPVDFDWKKVEPPYTVSCCECGRLAKVPTFNRTKHGSLVSGDPVMMNRVMPKPKAPALRVLRRESG